MEIFRFYPDSYLHTYERVLGKRRKRNKNLKKCRDVVPNQKAWRDQGKERACKITETILEKLSVQYLLANKEVRKIYGRMHYKPNEL